jgi:hypothetical protein
MNTQKHKHIQKQGEFISLLSFFQNKECRLRTFIGINISMDFFFVHSLPVIENCDKKTTNKINKSNDSRRLKFKKQTLVM